MTKLFGSATFLLVIICSWNMMIGSFASQHKAPNQGLRNRNLVDKDDDVKRVMIKEREEELTRETVLHKERTSSLRHRPLIHTGNKSDIFEDELLHIGNGDRILQRTAEPSSFESQEPWQERDHQTTPEPTWFECRQPSQESDHQATPEPTSFESRGPSRIIHYQEQRGGVSTGAIIGSIFGVVVIVGLIVGAIWYYRRGKLNGQDKPASETMHHEIENHKPSTPGVPYLYDPSRIQNFSNNVIQPTNNFGGHPPSSHPKYNDFENDFSSEHGNFSKHSSSNDSSGRPHHVVSQQYPPKKTMMSSGYTTCSSNQPSIKDRCRPVLGSREEEVVPVLVAAEPVVVSNNDSSSQSDTKSPRFTVDP